VVCCCHETSLVFSELRLEKIRLDGPREKEESYKSPSRQDGPYKEPQGSGAGCPRTFSKYFHRCLQVLELRESHGGRDHELQSLGRVEVS